MCGFCAVPVLLFFGRFDYEESYAEVNEVLNAKTAKGRIGQKRSSCRYSLLVCCVCSVIIVSRKFHDKKTVGSVMTFAPQRIFE